MTDRVLALVADGLLANLIGASEDFDAPEGDTYIDVTGTDPAPQIGWSYNAKRKAFAPPAAPEMTGDQLAALKADLAREVDDQAERERLKLITPGSGQAMEYQEAYAQAKAAIAAGDAAKAADYPMLAATIGVDFDPSTDKPATDVLGVARSVIAAYEGYLLAGAAIRGARLRGKAQIEAASDEAGVRAAADAVQWPTFK